ncbi:MAG: diphthine--ammonia ligase [Candidatus Marsarchaeota archaeon]|jgi:ABC transporter with metal-binding/Fe-S-binding domain ATP-binding protein|nr:diphthine--ammonia ligase [Candidatus Marsarchaeota archaeon]
MRACLFSGGKDSTLALHMSEEAGRRVDLLVTLIPRSEFSYMFHRPNVELTGLQAEALGMKHEMVPTPGEKEAELADLERALRDLGVDELVTGAIASTYQKNRVDALCAGLGIVHEAPLWGMDQVAEIGEVAARMNAIITRTAADGLDEGMLGKRIDDAMVERLIKLRERYKINVSFEGGEAETFVLDAPMFRKCISVVRAHVVMSGQAGTYVIDEARLEGKKHD